MSRRKNVDIGMNRYGLDMSYFRNLFDRELNKPLADFTPKELARVLARASRTADPDVMHEPEFRQGMAIVPVECLEVAERAIHLLQFNTSKNAREYGAITDALNAVLAAKEKGE